MCVCVCDMLMCCTADSNHIDSIEQRQRECLDQHNNTHTISVICSMNIASMQILCSLFLTILNMSLYYVYKIYLICVGRLNNKIINKT